MNRIRTILISLAALLWMAPAAEAQPDTAHYYYYKGEKVPLTQSEDYAFMIIQPGANLSSVATMEAVLPEGAAIVRFGETNVAQTLKMTGQARADATPEYWAEVALNRRHTYQQQRQELLENKGVRSVTPFYYDGSGERNRLGLSPYFYVKLQTAADSTLLQTTARDTGTEIVGRNRFMPLWYTLRCTENTLYNALEAANFFYETGLFEAAEPDLMVDDLSPYASGNSGSHNPQHTGSSRQNDSTAGVDTRLRAAWDITTGNPGVVVAILDHGFETDHPALAANVFGTGFDTETGTVPSVVRGDHGTACAGVIGAVPGNASGIAGVAPNTGLMSVSSSLDGQTPNIRQKLADGINWAVSNGADVISNSWGSNSLQSELIDNAIANALTRGRDGRGTVVVFASGNNDSHTSNYPANSHPDIINVGAIDRCGIRSGRIDVIPQSCDPWNNNSQPASAYGATLDVVAPGTNISTTDRQGTAGYDAGDYSHSFYGTSAACPYVAGVAALILSMNPELTARQVNTIIEYSAQKTGGYAYTTVGGRPYGEWNYEMGYGLVDAYAAVTLARGCGDHLTVDADVPPGATDRQAAGETLTATNTVAASARAVYHAGTGVVLDTGFLVDTGGAFLAYNEGCTGNFLAVTSGDILAIKTTKTDENNLASHGAADGSDSEGLILYPNPAVQALSVRLGEGNAYTVSIYDQAGHLMLRGDLTGETGSLSISHLSAGTYLIKVVNKNTAESGEGRFVIIR